MIIFLKNGFVENRFCITKIDWKDQVHLEEKDKA